MDVGYGLFDLGLMHILTCHLQRAKGDVKKAGRPDPYAYIPLERQKLNRRKKAKLEGQFSSIMKKAKKGSACGSRQLHKHKKI